MEKNVTEEFIYRSAVEKQTENRLTDMERGEEQMRRMERVTWKLTLPCVKWIANGQWEFAVWLRKLKQELCINLEGWEGDGDGRAESPGTASSEPVLPS